jgi:hypothetical protein
MTRSEYWRDSPRELAKLAYTAYLETRSEQLDSGALPLWTQFTWEQRQAWIDAVSLVESARRTPPLAAQLQGPPLTSEDL